MHFEKNAILITGVKQGVHAKLDRLCYLSRRVFVEAVVSHDEDLTFDQDYHVFEIKLAHRALFYLLKFQRIYQRYKLISRKPFKSFDPPQITAYNFYLLLASIFSSLFNRVYQLPQFLALVFQELSIISFFLFKRWQAALQYGLV